MIQELRSGPKAFRKQENRPLALLGLIFLSGLNPSWEGGALADTHDDAGTLTAPNLTEYCAYLLNGRLPRSNSGLPNLPGKINSSGVFKIDLGAPCSKLSDSLNQALDGAQKACIENAVAIQRFELRNKKNPNATKYGDCENPALTATLDSLLASSVDSADQYISTLIQTHAYQSQKQAEFNFARKIADFKQMSSALASDPSINESCRKPFEDTANSLGKTLDSALEDAQSSAEQAAPHGGAWADWDAQHGGGTMLPDEAKRYVKKLSTDPDPNKQKIAEMILEAQQKGPKHSAYCKALQDVVGSYHTMAEDTKGQIVQVHNGAPLEGSFKLDCDIQQRTIGDIRTLLETRGNEFMSKLCQEKLPLPNCADILDQQRESETQQSYQYAPIDPAALAPAHAANAPNANAPNANAPGANAPLAPTGAALPGKSVHRDRDPAITGAAQYANPRTKNDSNFYPPRLTGSGLVLCTLVNYQTRNKYPHYESKKFTKEQLDSEFGGVCPMEYVINNDAQPGQAPSWSFYVEPIEKPRP